MEESFLKRRLSRIPLAQVLSLAILAGGLTGAAVGLSRLARGLELILLLGVVTLALLAGWTLGRLRSGAWLSLTGGLLLGVAMLLLRLGGLSGRVFVLYWTASDWISYWGLNPRQPEPPVVPLITAWSSFWIGLSTSSSRIILWMADLLRGEARYDLLGTAFLWSISLWTAALWAGWAVRRGKSALAAFLPALALLAGTLAYSTDQVGPLGFLLAAVLFATVVLTHIQRETRWQTSGMDYSPEIRLDLGLYTIPITVGLFIIALIAPSISIQRLSQAVTDWTRAQGVEPEQAGQSLGLAPRPGPTQPLQNYRAPGLPRSHLIGSGPELSREIALTVRTFEIAPGPAEVIQQTPRRYYWRGLTYDRYTGRGWATSATQEQAYQPGDAIVSLDPTRYRILHQEVTRLRNPSDILHFTGSLRSASQPIIAAWRGEDDLFAARSQGTTFEIQSWVPAYDREELRVTSQDLPASVRNRYLSLPDTIPDRVLALARDLTASAPTEYDQALAIEAYLRELPYTLDLPAPPTNQDVVDYFLFDLKRGYCDYYATAMVVLARAAGLPARLSIGYATGGYDYPGARYVVTEADAHSWPEIYFPGWGWVQFEPTAAQPSIENPAGQSEAGGIPSPAAPILEDPITGGAVGLPPLLAWGLAVAAGLLLIGVAFRPWRILFPGFAGSPLQRARRMEASLRRTARWLTLPLSPGDTPGEQAERLAERLARHGKTAAASAVRTASAYIQSTYYASAPPPSSVGTQAEQGLAQLPGQILSIRLRKQHKKGE